MRHIIIFSIFLLVASFLFADAGKIVIPFREGANDDYCDCITSYELDPVCGTDGTTYPNPSSLKCANECEKTNIDILRKGYC